MDNIAISTWFKNFFSGEWVEESAVIESADNTIYKLLAVNTCVDYIASTVSLCEFQTKKKGAPFRGLEYWSFNVEPNPNQSAPVFWAAVTRRLLLEGECLVVKRNGYYFVANTFTRTQNGAGAATYTGVTIGDNDTEEIPGTLTEKKVLYFRRGQKNLGAYLNQLYSDIDALTTAAKDNYLLMSKLKILIKQDATYAQTKDSQDAMEQLVNEHLKKFLDPAKSNALPLRRGINYEDVSRKTSGTSSNAATDLETFVNSGLKQTARAFLIPPALLTGEIEGIDDAVTQYMTECIKPIVKVIADELNRKVYGRTAYEQGTSVFVDITRIRYADVKATAAALEALTRIGVNSIDDNLQAVGREAVGGEIGRQRWMTKNYDRIEQFFAEPVVDPIDRG